MRVWVFGVSNGMKRGILPTNQEEPPELGEICGGQQWQMVSSYYELTWAFTPTHLYTTPPRKET